MRDQRESLNRMRAAFTACIFLFAQLFCSALPARSEGPAHTSFNASNIPSESTSGAGSFSGNLDLSSTTQTLPAPVSGSFTMAGENVSVAAGQLLTPSQYVALIQAVSGGQSLELSSLGSAISGSLNLRTLTGSGSVNGFVVPSGVTALAGGSSQSQVFSVSGLANIEGQVFFHTMDGVFNAGQLQIAETGVLSNLMQNQNSALTINTAGSVVNAGLISSYGAVNLNVGQNLTNSGTIQSLMSNVAVTSMSPAFSIQNTGGQILAPLGSVGLASAASQANLSVIGGLIQGQTIDITAALGKVNVAADSIEGLVNVTAHEVAMTVAHGNLDIGTLCLSGDPIFNVAGSFTSPGGNFPGQLYQVTAGTGINITSDLDTSGGAGGDVILATGGPVTTTNITTGGGRIAIVGSSVLTGDLSSGGGGIYASSSGTLDASSVNSGGGSVLLTTAASGATLNSDPLPGGAVSVPANTIMSSTPGFSYTVMSNAYTNAVVDNINPGQLPGGGFFAFSNSGTVNLQADSGSASFSNLAVPFVVKNVGGASFGNITGEAGATGQDFIGVVRGGDANAGTINNSPAGGAASPATAGNITLVSTAGNVKLIPSGTYNTGTGIITLVNGGAPKTSQLGANPTTSNLVFGTGRIVNQGGGLLVTGAAIDLTGIAGSLTTPLISSNFWVDVKSSGAILVSANKNLRIDAAGVLPDFEGSLFGAGIRFEGTPLSFSGSGPLQWLFVGATPIIENQTGVLNLNFPFTITTQNTGGYVAIIANGTSSNTSGGSLTISLDGNYISGAFLSTENDAAWQNITVTGGPVFVSSQLGKLTLGGNFFNSGPSIFTGTTLESAAGMLFESGTFQVCCDANTIGITVLPNSSFQVGSGPNATDGGNLIFSVVNANTSLAGANGFINVGSGVTMNAYGYRIIGGAFGGSFNTYTGGYTRGYSGGFVFGGGVQITVNNISSTETTLNDMLLTRRQDDSLAVYPPATMADGRGVVQLGVGGGAIVLTPGPGYAGFTNIAFAGGLLRSTGNGLVQVVNGGVPGSISLGGSNLQADGGITYVGVFPCTTETPGNNVIVFDSLIVTGSNPYPFADPPPTTVSSPPPAAPPPPPTLSLPPIVTALPPTDSSTIIPTNQTPMPRDPVIANASFPVLPPPEMPPVQPGQSFVMNSGCSTAVLSGPAGKQPGGGQGKTSDASQTSTSGQGSVQSGQEKLAEAESSQTVVVAQIARLGSSTRSMKVNYSLQELMKMPPEFQPRSKGDRPAEPVKKSWSEEASPLVLCSTRSSGDDSEADLQPAVYSAVEFQVADASLPVPMPYHASPDDAGPQKMPFQSNPDEQGPSAVPVQNAGQGNQGVKPGEAKPDPKSVLRRGEKKDVPQFQQGQIPDCFLLAPAYGLAVGNPEALRRMITRNPDGSWTVTFPNGRKVTVTLTPAEIEKFAQGNSDFPWPAIIEKAYDKLLREMNPRKFLSKDNSLSGHGPPLPPATPGTPLFLGVPEEAAQFLTGESYASTQIAGTADTVYYWPFTDKERSRVTGPMTQLPGAQQSVMNLLGSIFPNSSSPPPEVPLIAFKAQDDHRNENPSEGLYAGHGYTIIGYDPDEGDPKKAKVRLRNPHGTEGKYGKEFEMTVEEFCNTFSKIVHPKDLEKAKPKPKPPASNPGAGGARPGNPGQPNPGAGGARGPGGVAAGTQPTNVGAAQNSNDQSVQVATLEMEPFTPVAMLVDRMPVHMKTFGPGKTQMADIYVQPGTDFVSWYRSNGVLTFLNLHSAEPATIRWFNQSGRLNSVEVASASGVRITFPPPATVVQDDEELISMDQQTEGCYVDGSVSTSAEVTSFKLNTMKFMNRIVLRIEVCGNTFEAKKNREILKKMRETCLAALQDDSSSSKGNGPVTIAPPGLNKRVVSSSLETGIDFKPVSYIAPSQSPAARISGVSSTKSANAQIWHLPGTDVSFDGSGNVNFEQGEAVITTSKRTVVRILDCVVIAEPGVTLLVKNEDNLVRISNLWEGRAGRVYVHSGSRQVSLLAGREILIGYGGVNPIEEIMTDRVGRRMVRQVEGHKGERILTADVSLLTMIHSMEVLRRLNNSPDRRDQAIVDKVLKMAAVLELVTGYHGQYSAVPVGGYGR